jgi:hypothetical protein
MRTRPQTIIAGVLLIVAALFSAQLSFDTIGNTFGLINEITFDASIFYLIANGSYAPIALTAVVAAIFAFLNRGKIAMIISGAATLLWFLSAITWVIGQSTVSVSLGEAIRNVTLGWKGDGFLGTLSALPTFIALAIASVLIFMGRKPTLADQVASRNYYHPSQGYQPPQAMPAMPSMPQQAGMKSCPECAEMIQANAIKCRFCNYRFQ